jgi:predicted RNA-binding protein YlxR (DUF448 family)
MTKTRHIPLRTCVVCRETSAKKTLLRVVRTAAPKADPPVAGAPEPAPQILFDLSGKANGRGAYVCATAECIEKAIKQKRFERSLGVSAVSDTLAEDLRRAAAALRPAGVNVL